MKPFRIPDESIGALDAITAAQLVAASCDIALALDRAGRIEDMAIQPSHLAAELEGYGRWFGRLWADTVTADGQAKVDAMLAEAGTAVASSWRQLSHTTIGGREVAILYSVVKIGSGERFIALGRDMRNVVAMQQRLIDAQMSMERDYAKLRFAETRYRLLFQTSAEPILILDGHTHKVVEANPAAAALLEGGGGKRLVGRPFADLLPTDSRPGAAAFLADLRGNKPAAHLDIDLAGAGPVTVTATAFRAEGATLFLLRLQPEASGKQPLPPSAPRADGTPSLADFAQALPDGLVVADAAGRILDANPAFGDMAQIGDAQAAGGARLDRWLGRPGIDFDLMMASLRQHKVLRLFSTVLRGEGGDEVDVELSAAALERGKETAYGFALRDVGRRLEGPARPAGEITRSAEQLAGLIGRVPLKDIVRETTDVIEKLCIETALELTGDNRASAAEVLGLSRQSLYVKLRRFGIDEVSTGSGA